MEEERRGIVNLAIERVIWILDERGCRLVDKIDEVYYPKGHRQEEHNDNDGRCKHRNSRGSFPAVNKNVK